MSDVSPVQPELRAKETGVGLYNLGKLGVTDPGALAKGMAHMATPQGMLEMGKAMTSSYVQDIKKGDYADLVGRVGVDFFGADGVGMIAKGAKGVKGVAEAEKGLAATEKGAQATGKGAQAAEKGVPTTAEAERAAMVGKDADKVPSSLKKAGQTARSAAGVTLANFKTILDNPLKAAMNAVGAVTRPVGEIAEKVLPKSVNRAISKGKDGLENIVDATKAKVAGAKKGAGNAVKKRTPENVQQHAKRIWEGKESKQEEHTNENEQKGESSDHQEAPAHSEGAAKPTKPPATGLPGELQKLLQPFTKELKEDWNKLRNKEPEIGLPSKHGVKGALEYTRDGLIPMSQIKIPELVEEKKKEQEEAAERKEEAERRHEGKEG